MPPTKAAARLVALLLLLALGRPATESHAFPQLLSGQREDRVVPAARLPLSTSLNPSMTLEPRGRVLLVSNSPEYLQDAARLPGALYRDRVEGAFRVFYHHANGSNAALTVATAITNVSESPVFLYREGVGQGENIYPDVAGQQAVRRYLASRGEVEDVAVLPPGGSVLVAPQRLEIGATVSALQDFAALRAPQASTASAARSADAPPPAPAEVIVSVVAYADAPPRRPAALSVVPGPPPEPVSGTRYHALHRGTFPHADRFADLALPAAGGPLMLSVDSAAYGPYSSAMTGEYELGSSAVDGLEGYINGNYGVVYTFRLELAGERARSAYAFLLQPSGGFGHYSFEVGGDAAVSPFVSHREAWWFYHALSYGGAGEVLLETSLPGGSFGPQKLFFVPDLSAWAAAQAAPAAPPRLGRP